MKKTTVEHFDDGTVEIDAIVYSDKVTCYIKPACGEINVVHMTPSEWEKTKSEFAFTNSTPREPRYALKYYSPTITEVDDIT